MKIGIVAPSSRFDRATAKQVTAVAAAWSGEVELIFHPQCFETDGHFAGSDEARLKAFVEMANDPGLGALWFARGGYGACRIAQAAIAALGPQARNKAYLGYSDGGYLLAGLYQASFPDVAHGPVVQDVIRPGGDAAVRRALAWLTKRDRATIEPHVAAGGSHAAFNLTVLGLLLGTPLEPDLSDHVLMLEEVGEHAYRIDRAMFHLTTQRRIQRLAGIRLGRVSAVPENDPPFGATPEAIVSYWCQRSGVPYLGSADIGHDADNKVVPFGRF